MNVELSQGHEHLAEAGSPRVEAYLQAVRRDLQGWLPGAIKATVDALERARREATTPNDRQWLSELHADAQRQGPAWANHFQSFLSACMDSDVQLKSAAEPTHERALTLTLLDEDSIDEDIALSRLVQVAELRGEASLRELAARCSRLRGLSSVSPDANPMRPAVVAGALRRAVADLGFQTPKRLLLLRELAQVFGGQLAAVYARQVDMLTDWGVEPTEFTVRLTLDVGAGRAGPAGAGGRRGRDGRESLEDSAKGLAADALRRLDVGGAEPDALAPADAMARLLSVLLSRAALSDGARRMIQRLDEPARRLAVSEPDLWKSVDHPLWQLLDRLVSAGSVHEGFDFTRTGFGTEAFEAAVTQLEQTDPPDTKQLRAALDAADEAVTGLLDQEVERVAPQAEAMEARLTRKDIELQVREQIVEQVRYSAIPLALRRFLVGPWAAAVAHSAETHGHDSTQFQVQAELVEDMVDACRRPHGRPVDPGTYTRCITHARLGLMDAGFPAARVEAELLDLGRVLRVPWTEPEPDAPLLDDEECSADQWSGGAPMYGDAEGGPVTLPADEDSLREHSHSLGLHEALPTVRIDMGGPEGLEASGEDGAASAWLDALEPGVLCRLFLLERWMNAQLVWRSLNRSMFVFSSRHGERTHSLGRAALQKLRNAGLATTIERGQFIAQALGELARGDAR